MVAKKDKTAVREVAFAVSRVFREKRDIFHRASRLSGAAARKRMGKEIKGIPNYQLQKCFEARKIIEKIDNTCVESALIVNYYELVVFGLCFLTPHHNDDLFEHILSIQTDLKKMAGLVAIDALKDLLKVHPDISDVTMANVIRKEVKKFLRNEIKGVFGLLGGKLFSAICKTIHAINDCLRK